jgi:hypothetical protein
MLHNQNIVRKVSVFSFFTLLLILNINTITGNLQTSAVLAQEGSGNKVIHNFIKANITKIAVSDKMESPKVPFAGSDLENHTIPPIPVNNETIQGPVQGTEAKIVNAENNSQINNPSKSVKQISMDTINGNTFHRVGLGDSRIFATKLVCHPGSAGLCHPCPIGPTGASCTHPCPPRDAGYCVPWEINEPTVANNGRTVFFAGNRYAGSSEDGGETWQYTNPANHGTLFTSDQDVIYDATHRIFIWYIQGGYMQNSLSYATVAVSHNARDWWYYRFSPATFDTNRANQWFDFPHIAISNNNFYLTTNMHTQNIQNPTFQGTLVTRWDIVAMSNHAGSVSVLYITNPAATITPVQGATDTMYFGTTGVSNNLLRVFKWPENSARVESADSPIPSWQPAGNMVFPDCPSPSNTNWCSRVGSTGPNPVSGGWVLDGLVGFVWNAEQGAGFPHSYVNGAVFDANNLVYNHRLVVWSVTGAVMLAHISVSRNMLAMAAYYADPTHSPSVIVTTFTNSQNSIPFAMRVIDAHGDTLNIGDYIRIRPYGGTGFLDGYGPLWVGSGYTVQSYPNNTQYIQPFYYIFGIEGPAGNQCGMC